MATKGPLLNKARVKDLALRLVKDAHREAVITQIGGDVFVWLEETVERTVTRMLQTTIASHPSSFRTLKAPVLRGT